MRQGARPAGRPTPTVAAPPAPSRRRRAARAALRLPPQRPGRLRLPPRRLAALRSRRRSPRSPTPISATATRAATTSCAPRSPTISAASAASSPTPARVVVTNGFGQGLGLVCRALADARREADRDRGPEQHRAVRDRRPGRPRTGPRRRSTSTGCASTTSRAGRRRDRHARPPASDRRRAQRPSAARPCSPGCASTTRSRSRTTTTPSTATTAPPSARSRGSSPTASSTPARRSKTLAPALRLGWLVVPRACASRVRHEKLARRPGHGADRAARVRRLHRRAASSTVTCAACAPATARAATRSSARSQRELPEATVRGIAAGLHVTVELPAGLRRSRRSRRRRASGGSRSTTMADYSPAARRR